jgi:hypothetical protein
VNRGRGYFTGLWRCNSRYSCQIKTMTIRSNTVSTIRPNERV